MDEIDVEILGLLQEDGRMPHAEIARRVGRAPSAVHERIRSLEAEGVIVGYEARLDPARLGSGLLAFVFVDADEIEMGEGAAEALAGIREVQEVHHVAGDDCFLIKVRANDPRALGILLRERIGALPSVRSTRTTIVLETVKESQAVPLEGARSEITT